VTSPRQLARPAQTAVLGDAGHDDGLHGDVVQTGSGRVGRQWAGRRAGRRLDDRQPDGRQPDGQQPDGQQLAIASNGLSMRFRGGQLAVDHIDLAVPAGSVYGFLGPNGSGKTTTIRMLLGLVYPTGGAFRLLGADPDAGLDKVLPRVGALVEGPAFYPFLSGRQNLARCDAADPTADLSTGPARIDRALDQVGLLAAADKRYRAYSLGMKQRLGIASGLLRPRDLMILDEPTNGLDPQGTREIRSLIKQIAADGTTVFVSSHLLAEVEQICSHVGVMSTGRLVFQGPLAELRSRGEPRILVRTLEPARAAEVLAALGLVEIAAADAEITARLGEHVPERINVELVHAGVPVAGLETVRPSLEDLFVQLTGEGFNVNG
jgi:ABC-2 type transport system ATP-binding protein